MWAVPDVSTGLQGPVDYSERWAWLALAALVAVAVYYAAVVWWTRAPRATTGPARQARPTRSARRRHLRRLDVVARQVRDREITAREGHQQVSATVRGFVQSVSDLRAGSMSLATLRATAPEPLVALVTDLYEPAFAGDEPAAAATFDDTVARAREVVTSWT